MAGNLLGNLKVRLTAETEDFRRGLRGARGKLNTFEQQLNKFRRSTLTNVLGVTALATGFVKLVSSTADAADKIDKMSIRTGVAREKLQELEYVGDQLGVSLDSMAKVTESLTRRLPGIAQGTGPAADAMKQLGVSLHDSGGQMRDMGELFPDIVRGLSSMENDTERNALATQLFGRRAMELVPMLEAGGDEVERLSKRARDLGLVMSDEAITELVAYKDAMAEIKAQVGAAGRELVMSMLPALKQVAPVIQGAIKEVELFGADLGLIAGYMRGVKALFTEGLGAAREEIRIAHEVWRDMTDEIRNGVVAPITVPVNIDTGSGSGSTVLTEIAETGRIAANTLADSLESEWERLRHDIVLRRLQVTGTEPERYAAELEHAKRMLAIDQARLEAEHRAGTLSTEELAAGQQQLQIRRQIAEARRREYDTTYQQIEQQRAAQERESVLLTDALERERMLSEFEIARLGTNASLADQLQLQLNLTERTFQLQREALLENSSLSDAARAVELEKLELAKEREQLQLRMNAAVEEELQSLEKHRGLLGSIVGLVEGLLSGRGLSGASIGGMIGGMLGKMVPVVGGLLGGIGSKIGSMIGGLFGGNRNDKKNIKPLRALEAVEKAQRETITTIKQQTQKLLNPKNSYLNLPTSFTLPNYKPTIPNMRGAGAPQTISYGDVAVNMEFNVSGGHSAEDIKQLAMEGVSQAIGHSRRISARHTGFLNSPPSYYPYA